MSIRLEIDKTALGQRDMEKTRMWWRPGAKGEYEVPGLLGQAGFPRDRHELVPVYHLRRGSGGGQVAQRKRKWTWRRWVDRR